MDKETATEFKSEIDKIVDLLIQADSIKESIASRKKDIKEQFGIPVTTLNKIVTILRKQNLEEEQEKWDEIKTLVDLCQ